MSIQQNVNFVEKGRVRLFSDFDTNGPMWSEHGDREIVNKVHFSNVFVKPPIVSLSVVLMDAAAEYHLRYSLEATHVSRTGFEVLFRTWMDSKFARVWVEWTAFGERQNDDYWHDL